MERYRDAATAFEDSIAALAPILAADAHDNGTRFSVGTIRANQAFTLLNIAPNESAKRAAEAIAIVDAASRDPFDVRAQCRIIAAEAERASGRLKAAEALLEEAEHIIGGRDTVVVADLNRAWGNLNAARGDETRADLRFEKAIERYENELASAPTPSNAWVLTHTLQFAAAAVPSKAASRRQRILEVWVNQDRRYPHSPYIEKQLAAARRAFVPQ